MNKKGNIEKMFSTNLKNGITLVALVITIIILLILAGITINLTIGQNGILVRAKDAGKNYQKEAQQEEENLGEFLQDVDNIIVGTTSSNEDKYTIIDGVPVPKGFEYIKSTTKEEGFVIRDNSETNTKGNEFVWVPCTENGNDGSIKYDRYAFSKEGWTYTQTKDEITGEIRLPTYEEYSFTETIPKEEIDSIRKYGGFYIGRYEVGIEGYQGVETNNTNKEKEWTGYTNGKAVIQEDKQVWNYITRDMAKKVAEEMYKNNDIVKSRLCSSYAWDTTLKFIETKSLEYTINSVQGNYSGNVKNTGKGSIAVNNIYDMAGNAAEWTTENYSNKIAPCTRRGGGCKGNASISPAGFRDYYDETFVNDDIGFRTTLYII